MSVIRYPGQVDRGRRRRLVGLTASVATALVDTIAVSIWLALVVIGTRTALTALLGLGILLVGAFLRSRIFGSAVGERRSIRRPGRLATAVAVATGWVAWIFVAEWIGSVLGMVVGGVVLGACLLFAFFAERVAVIDGDVTRSERPSLVSPLVLALGSSVLLASLWFTTWTTSLTVSGGSRPLLFTIDAVHLGVLLFALCAFLAHRRRVRRYLGV